MTFKHILLALDRPQKADLVLAQGLSLAAQYNACNDVVHHAPCSVLIVQTQSLANKGTG